MPRSFRGKEIDMNTIAKKFEQAIALGNASMNGRGDIVKAGKVVKSREEQLAEYYEANTFKSGEVDLKKDGTDIEEEIKQVVQPVKRESDLEVKLKKIRKPVYEDITEEEKVIVDNV